jgi:hypothetical protein
MRKRDCLYVHALCVLVRRELDRRGDLPEGAFERYERLGVRPTAVHRPKAEHERATFELLDALTDAVDGPGDRPRESSSTGTGRSDLSPGD